MSLQILPSGLATSNPNLIIPSTAEAALKNAVFYSDCQTFDGGTPTQMTDLSGAGNHAQWSAVPTTSADGVHFDGVKYFDLPDGLGDDNVTVYAVVKLTGSGGSLHLCGNLDETGDTGFAFYLATGWMMRGRYGSASNDTTLVGTEATHTNVATNAYALIKMSVARQRQLIERMDTGTITISRRKNATTEPQPPWPNGWRFGGTRNAGALYLPTTNARLGAVLMIDTSSEVEGLTTRAQDVAVYQFMKTEMATRSVTLP